MTDKRKTELYLITKTIVDYGTFNDMIDKATDPEEKEYIKDRMMYFYHQDEASAEMI